MSDMDSMSAEQIHKEAKKIWLRNVKDSKCGHPGDPGLPGNTGDFHWDMEAAYLDAAATVLWEVVSHRQKRLKDAYDVAMKSIKEMKCPMCQRPLNKNDGVHYSCPEHGGVYGDALQELKGDRCVSRLLQFIAEQGLC